MACLVLSSFGGCAVSPHEPSPGAVAGDVSATLTAPPPATSTIDLAASDATPAPAPGTSTAAVSVDVKDFKGKTVCEPIVATGTRMVVAKHCYTQDQDNDKVTAARTAKTREQLEDLRHSQEMGERMDRQREMDRQRAAMSSLFP
jgi:hypothetical protein